MNTPNRPKAPRRSAHPIAYRRKRRGIYWRVGLISAAITVLIIMIALLIVGNVLLSSVEPQKEESKADTNIQDPPAYPRPSSVQAHAALPSSLPSLIPTFQEKGFSAVSLSLNGADGSLLYRSPIAISLGLQSSNTALSSLSSAIAASDEAGMHLSAIFYLPAFSEENDLLRSVKLSQSAAIIIEAIRDGIDDITLIAPDLSPEQSKELLALLSDIRALEPNSVLGVTVNSSFLNAENTDSLLNELHSAVNYLAIDLTPIDGQAPSVFADNRLNDSQLRYYLLYYRMRLLLPQGQSVDEQSALLAVIAENSFDDWQFLTE